MIRIPTIIHLISVIAALALHPLVTFAVGSPSAPEYKAGADSSAQINTGTGNIAFGPGAGQHSIVINGNYAYVLTNASSTACANTGGNAGNGCELKVFDVSNPTSPTYVGGGDASGSTNSGTGSNGFNGIAISGTNAYIITSGNSTACSSTAGSAIGCELQVWDISTPSAPAYIGGGDATGSTNTGTGNSSGNDIAISSGHAYTTWDRNAGTCSGTAGSAIGCELKVWDISTPSAPSYTDGNDGNGTSNGGTTATVDIRSIAISGTNAYTLETNSSTACSSTAGSGIGCEFKVWDISTAATPTYSAGMDSTGQANKGGGIIDGFGIHISGNYAFTTWQDSIGTCAGTIGSATGCEVKIWDITVASSTYVEGGDASGSTNSGTSGVLSRHPFVSGNYLYTLWLNNATGCSQTAGSAIGCELKVWDVTTPTSISYIGGGDSSGSTNTGTGNGDSSTMYVTSTHAFTGWQGDATTCSGTAGSAVGCELKIWEIGVAAAALFDSTYFEVVDN